MWRILRSQALWTGVALIALGGGNWINGHIKLAAYEALLAHEANPPAMTPPAGFPRLNERTNAGLLRPLRSAAGTRSLAENKREFYAVVKSGGRLIALAGAFLLVVAAVRHRRRHA